MIARTRGTRRRALRPALAVAIAFTGALAPLLLLDGDRRAQGFRVYGVALGVLALRAVVGFTVDAGVPPVDSPFHRPRALPRRLDPRRRHRPDRGRRRTPADHLVAGAVHQASAFHFRLRPALRHAADERLQARHGVTIDDPRAAAILGPAVHDHLRRDRPPPDDRRGPGIEPAALDAILTTVENL